MRRSLRSPFLAAFAAAALLTLASCGGGSGGGGSGGGTAQSPNILFIVLDDLGVDQLPVFGYGGLTPAATPNLDAIAHAGVRFRNAWSMPTCTPTRATFFVGRYPSRTNVLNAVVATDLANSQVSPFEATTPKLLKDKGYVNAVIGKMHLSGSNLNPANHPLGDAVMRELGWDHFEGYLDGGPYPVDTTAGGVGPEGAHGCGFVRSTRDDPAHGADAGACYTADGGCTTLSTADTATPGRACMERGGILDPGQACRAPRPAHLDFATQNGYYTGEWLVNQADGSTRTVPASDATSRGYRTVQETDRAVRWLRQQSGRQPWMLSVGYSAIHTPLQPPPASLLPAGAEDAGGFGCESVHEQRVLTNQMIEAMDREIGRLLVDAGIAKRRADGTLDYRPQDSNTVVVVMGDNGSYAPSVKAPFNPLRAKGFPYQTGVWVPLIVAGPMVKEPDRDVPHMVNSADLYSLFGELAGIDVRRAVPASRTLDAQPVLPYLTDPAHAAIRSTNFSEVGTNIANASAPPAPPCVIPALNTCVQLFPQQEVCEDQGGTWYGAGGAAGAGGLASCCAVNDYLETQGGDPVDILPRSQRTVRNAKYKLVRVERMNCSTNQFSKVDEFFRVDEATPLPRLDNARRNLLPGLTQDEQQNYVALQEALRQIDAANVACPGDGNLDGVVDAQDLADWAVFSTRNGGRSSWYDFNHDGRTDGADRAVIESRLGKRCGAAGS
jgi:arylsulfatase A-like enzyme